MKYLERNGFFYCIVFLLFCYPLIAQTDQQNSIIEAGIGINAFGPAVDMNRYMIDHHFDETSENWFWGGTTQHPHYDKVGFSVHLLYASSTNKGKWLGIMAEYAFLSEVFGEHQNVSHLFVKFYQFNIAPTYIIHINNNFDTRFGPVLAFNTGTKTSGINEPRNHYNKVSAGIFAETTLKLWDKSISYGKISTRLNLYLPSKLGPYTAYSYFNYNQMYVTIPEERYTFSHFNLKFIYGFKL